jgi:membrane-bound lytic murein transglycosylase D
MIQVKARIRQHEEIPIRFAPTIDARGPLMLFSLLLAVAFGSSGCMHSGVMPGFATADQPRIKLAEIRPGDANESGREPGQAQEAAVEADSEAGDGEELELTEEDLEVGLCKDDIYATWLKTQYYRQAAAPAPKQGTEFDANTNPGGAANRKLYSRGSRKGRARRSAAESRDMAALHYAANRFVGRMDDYYGGLPLVAHPRVEFWIRYFKTQGRASFLKWLVRGESVHQVVAPLLREQGLPAELYFLAMVESGFSNAAYSRARATGTWQFMSGTAKLYGLRIDYWVDERRDPVKSTIAAASFLRDLYEDFGDWHLAMAAYNAGPGKIRKAMRQTGKRTFWDIADTNAIRPETKHYVPKVLAALTLASNPKLHGFDVKPDPGNEIPATAVVVREPIRLSEVAVRLDVPLRSLKSWNPELIHEITPPRRARDNRKAVDGYRLRLPESLVTKYAEIENNLAAVEVKDIHMHRIRPGETLARIAQRYQVRVSQILSLNPSLRPTRLKTGAEIAVPVPSVVAKVQAAGRS